MATATGARRARRIGPALGLSTTALALGLGALPAAAQDSGAFTPLGRIVLGFGAPRVAIDTPQAVTVVAQEDLDREQADTLSDALVNVPGVQTAGSPRFSGQAFNIRGIGNTEQTASEARIIVTVDGAPKFFEQYRMGSFFGDLDLYKQIEILRGPASSTLYGAGAIGGVVNFTTKDAGDFLTGDATQALRFRTGFEDNGDAYSASVIYATRPTEGFELLAALNLATAGDAVDGNGAPILGSGYDRLSGLLKGTWRFGSDRDQSLRLSFSRTDGTLDNTVVAQTGDGLPQSVSGRPGAVETFGRADIDTRDDTLVIGYSHEFASNPWLDLDVTLSWTDTEVQKRNFTGTCGAGQSLVLCDNDAAYETVSLKVENTAEFGGGDWRNFLTFGAQLSRQDRTASAVLSGEPTAMTFHPEGQDTRLAAYAQGEFVWNDRLTLVPGLRIERSERSGEGMPDRSDTLVSPKLAVLYQIDKTWSVFGSVARTERAPTLDELYSTEGQGFGGTAPRSTSLQLVPETARTVELGVTWDRSDLFTEGDSLQVKATAFRNDLSDLIATTPRPVGSTPVPYFSNIAQARIWGAEVEAAYDADRVFGSLAYAGIRSRDEATGRTLADTPAENVVLTLGTRFPEHGLELGWRAAWFAGITTSSASTSGSAYDRHDVFATWTPESGLWDGYSVNLAVENVFDTTYRNNLSQDNGAGRTVKLTLARALDW